MLAGIVCEDQALGDIGGCYPFSFDNNLIYSVIENINKKEIAYGLETSTNFIGNICGIMEAWSSGEDFFEIVKNTGISEGDFVNLCRRTSDLLRQIKSACRSDICLKQKLDKCLFRIDRGMVILGL